MLGLRGSFLGFTYNDIHSSVLGITRVTDGDMFQKKMTPTFKHVSVEKPKNDGMYWYGGTYSQRDFVVNFAFEEIDEEQLRRMQMEWNDKKIHGLIFDEEPYKIYSAKITGMITIKHLCFEKTINEKQERIYRGEGSITFTCYYPFARSRFPYVEDYTISSVAEWCNDFEEAEYGILSDRSTGATISLADYELQITDGGATIESASGMPIAYLQALQASSEYVNINEWLAASRIPSRSKYGKWESGYYLLYNAGDLEIPFKIYFELPSTVERGYNLEISCLGHNLKIENLRTKYKNTTLDKYIEIDSYLNTIQGCDVEFKRTGNLYNEYITDGDFFTLPLGDSPIACTSQPAKAELMYLYL